MNAVYRYNRDQAQIRESSLKTNLKKAKGILNRITLENFNSAFESLLILTDLIVNGEHVLQMPICELIFEVAVGQPIYSSLYARLCSELIENVGLGLKRDEIKTSRQTLASKQFKLHIMSLLQKNFEKISSNERVLRSNQDFKDENGRQLEDKIRKSTHGLLLFIGELYCNNVVTSSIINSCMSYLINKGPSENNVELFVTFFKTVGGIFDQDKNKKEIAHYFEKVDEYMRDKNVTFRSKFMLSGLNLARKDQWVDLGSFNRPQTLNKIRGWCRLQQIRNTLIRRLKMFNDKLVWIQRDVKPENYLEIIKFIDARLHIAAIRPHAAEEAFDISPIEKNLRKLFVTAPSLVPVPAVSVANRQERDDLMVHNTILEYIFNSDLDAAFKGLETIKAKNLCGYFVYKFFSYVYDKGAEVRTNAFALLSYSRLKNYISINEFVSGARKFSYDLYDLALDYPKAYMHTGTLLATFPLSLDQLLSITILLNQHPYVNGNGAILFFYYWVAAKHFNLEISYAQAILQRKDDTSVMYALWNPCNQTLKDILKLTLHPKVNSLKDAFSETIWYKFISIYRKSA